MERAEVSEGSISDAEIIPVECITIVTFGPASMSRIRPRRSRGTRVIRGNCDWLGGRLGALLRAPFGHFGENTVRETYLNTPTGSEAMMRLTERIR
jgi:hypothetical protein